MNGDRAPCSILDWTSGMTTRVCRSTLAAEASHLAAAVETADWVAMLVAELRTRCQLDLARWSEHVDEVQRVWVTDAKSVYDHLTKESSTAAKDRRMAIEGALLRETLARRNAGLRWVDGSQNVADILTKLVLEEDYFWCFIRDAAWSLVQEKAAAEHKAKKRAART